MVQYKDGGIMAQLGMPDMKLPIQYALFYPERKAMAEKRVDFFELKSMTFEEADTDTFKGLALAYKAGTIGGSMPTVYNAANEKCVDLFLNNKISFLEISEIIEKCMDHHKVIDHPSVSEILITEEETYEYIKEIV
jgi:1-deoxy-D-xylulose-5-phosphate reductoisomerase